jgi:hypothetical protein
MDELEPRRVPIEGQELVRHEMLPTARPDSGERQMYLTERLFRITVFGLAKTAEAGIKVTEFSFRAADKIADYRQKKTLEGQPFDVPFKQPEE